MPWQSSLLVASALLVACGDDSNSSDGSNAVGSAPEVEAMLTVEYVNDLAGREFTYRIACAPETTSVTGAVEDADISARRACEALARSQVRQRLVEGPDQEVCTEQYGGADVVRIDGTVAGEAVSTTVDRTDGCGIAAWDDLLDPILPRPIGVIENEHMDDEQKEDEQMDEQMQEGAG